MEKSLSLCSPSPLKMYSDGRRLPEDRISCLLDDILVVILSFLTIKEMVKTSLLSRRWLNLWVNTPVLDFHAPVSDATSINDRERRNYVKWVNHVLRQHESLYLKEFKIVCCLDKHYWKDINRWLVFALARKVENLELSFLLSGRDLYNESESYVFPDPFLKFSWGKADSVSRLLKFDLKCLKSLSLKSVNVTSEAINFFLLNCPFLERLEVVGSKILVNLVISDPSLVLKYLKIEYCFNLKVVSISNFNLVSLDILSPRDLTLTNLPMLVELSIATNSSGPHLSEATLCHSQLEALKLDAFQLKDVPQLSISYQLKKLKRLAINVGAWGDESLTMLISYINYCPRLEEFKLMMTWYEPRRTSGPIREVKRQCSSLKNKSLKVFDFRGYYGRSSDVELIMHVVENVVALEKIILDPTDEYLSGPSETPTMIELDARCVAFQQLNSLREAIPPHVELLLL